MGNGVRPVDCASCYVAAERNGVLAHQLKKAASQLHVVLQHPRDWHRCPELPCREHAAVMKGAQLPRD